MWPQEYIMRIIRFWKNRPITMLANVTVFLGNILSNTMRCLKSRKKRQLCKNYLNVSFTLHTNTAFIVLWDIWTIKKLVVLSFSLSTKIAAAQNGTDVLNHLYFLHPKIYIEKECGNKQAEQVLIKIPLFSICCIQTIRQWTFGWLVSSVFIQNGWVYFSTFWLQYFLTNIGW